MNAERLTNKTAEAINAAQSVATRAGHPELKPAHLVTALLEQEGGLARPLLEKAIGPENLSTLNSQLSTHLTRQPSVSGSSGLGMSNDLRILLAEAEHQQKSLKDEYLSVEHLLLSLTKVPGE